MLYALDSLISACRRVIASRETFQWTFPAACGFWLCAMLFFGLSIVLAACSVGFTRGFVTFLFHGKYAGIAVNGKGLLDV